MKAILAGTCLALVAAVGGCGSSTTRETTGPAVKTRPVGTAFRAHQSVVQQQSQYFPPDGNITSPFAFGPTGCPIMIGGRNVWSFQAAAPTGSKLPLEFLVQRTKGISLLNSISIDGKYVAQLHAGNGRSDPGKAQVFSIETGQLVLDIPNCRGRFISVTSDDCVHVLGDQGRSLVTWNLQSRQEISRLRLPCEVYLDHELAVRSDGAYCICGNDQQLEAFVYDLASGEKVLTLPVPREELVQRGVKSFFPPRYFAFSPEGDEIYGAMDLHVIAWDLQGQNVFLARTGDVGKVVPLPGKTGVIMGNTFVDRANARPLVEFRTARMPLVLDQDRLIFQRMANPSLAIFTIPWEKIEASLAAMNDPTAAIIAPGKTIAIHVTAEGDAGEAVQRVIRNLEAKAAIAGVTVDPSSATKIEVKITEETLEKILLIEIDPLSPGNKPDEWLGKKTGRTNQYEEMVAYADMKLLAPTGQVVWQQKFFSHSDQGYTITSSNADARRNAYLELSRHMQGFNFPYFVPVSPELIALPLTVQ